MEYFGAILTKDGYWTLVSLEDFYTVSRFKWETYAPKSTLAYPKEAPGTIRYVLRSSAGEFIRLHRDLMKPTGDLVVDHINRVTLDNRRTNLRVVTRSENMRNTRDRHRPDGLPRCIYRKKKAFRVEIRRNKRKAVQRYFKTLEEAVKFRDEYLALERAAG